MAGAEVYDIDQHDEYKSVIAAPSSLAGNISVTFPAVAPYITMGTKIANGITELPKNVTCTIEKKCNYEMPFGLLYRWRQEFCCIH